MVCFQVVVSSRFLANIKYMGHCFIGCLVHALFGVLFYAKYLCLVTISVQSLVMSSCFYELQFLLFYHFLSAI